MKTEIRIPQYKKLQSLLQKQINDGVLKEGEYLPSENHLSITYSVTRTTIRQVLDELTKEGYIQKLKGKGSVVVARRKSLEVLSMKAFTNMDAGKFEKIESNFIQKPQLISWPEPFFYSLEENLSDFGCFHFERLRYINQHPVILDNTYLPNINLPRFINSKFENGSLFETLNLKYNIQVKEIIQELKSEPATERTANLFGIPINSPLIRIFRKHYTNKKNFIFYSSLCCNTEHYTISNQFKN